MICPVIPKAPIYEKKVISLVNVDSIITVEDAFRVLRGFAWDLWGAASFMAEGCGILIENAPQSRGVGPKGNVLAQGENLVTGLYCAILKAMGHVQDTEVFGGYDT